MWKRCPSTLNVECWAIVRNFSQNKAKIALKISEKPSYSDQAALTLSQSSVLSSVTTAQSLGTIWALYVDEWRNFNVFFTFFCQRRSPKKRWPSLQRAGSPSSGEIFVWDFFIPLVQSEFCQEITKARSQDQYPRTNALCRSYSPPRVLCSITQFNIQNNKWDCLQ